MTRWSRSESEREEEDYRGDVLYEVWRNGGNPDLVDYDRVSENFYAGQLTDACAYAELQAQQPAPYSEYDDPHYVDDPYSEDPGQESEDYDEESNV